MEEKEIQNELAAIRGLMERSAKFISLSGLSGILAGIYALIGAGFAYNVVNNAFPAQLPNNILVDDEVKIKLIIIAVLVLIASILTGYALSARKAKQKGQSIWTPTSRTLLFHMATPLVAGGLLILVLLAHGHYGIVSASSLIFYGLALVSASNFTFSDVKYLGLCEIVLGLIAACLPGYGLLFWALGFGVLHIIYGSLMYFKYDR